MATGVMRQDSEVAEVPPIAGRLWLPPRSRLRTPQRQDLRAAGLTTRLFVSVQVEVAWVGVMQLVFADPDLAAWGAGIPANLDLFANIGLANGDFSPKPALPAWDALFARALRPDPPH